MRPGLFLCQKNERRYFFAAVQFDPFMLLPSTVPAYFVVPAVKLMLAPSSLALVIGVVPSVPERFWKSCFKVRS